MQFSKFRITNIPFYKVICNRNFPERMESVHPDPTNPKDAKSHPPYELIVAMNGDGYIGITDASGNQKIPWYLPEDLTHFKETTMGHIVVMGRKTFDSLPNGPLPGRLHVVITRTPVWTKNPAVIHTNMEDFDQLILNLHELHPAKTVFICGGADIYRIFLDKCPKLRITVVHNPIMQFCLRDSSRISPENVATPALLQAQARSTGSAPKDGENLIMFSHSIDYITDNFEVESCSQVLMSKSGIKYEFWEFVKMDK